MVARRPPPAGWGLATLGGPGHAVLGGPIDEEAGLDIIDRHFAAENAHDVQATLDTYTDDIVWDDVTHPDAPFHGKEAVGNVYSSIIDAIPDVVLDSVKRFTGEGGRFVVDESVLTGHVRGEWAGMDGAGAPVEVRILHIFELRDGLICYENAWFNAADVQRQILDWKATAG
jgi:steroid delta-isomerase-like uncharacterized protein